MSDLTTTEGVLAYLQNTPYAASDVQRLSGGHSAFTYRITLNKPLLTGEKTLVLKHYEWHSSDDPLKLDPKRAEFEYKALSAVATSNLFDSNSTVQTPRAVHYDSQTHTVFMTDLGSPVMLRRALVDSPRMATEIGVALGDFLGRFHNWGAAPERAELREACSHNAAGKSSNLFEDRFKLMKRSVERFGLGEKCIDELVAKRLEEGLARGKGEVLAIGGFWMDNVLVSMPDASSCLRIYIIDWELVLPTYAEYDMGDFIGSALRIGREQYPQGDDRFVSAVLGAYRSHQVLNPVWMAIETGTFAVGYGCGYAAPDDPFAKDLALTGLALARLGWIEDERGIRQSLLKDIFPPSVRAGCRRCRWQGCQDGCTTERTVMVR